MNDTTGLPLYRATAAAASRPVLRNYSNSFKLATSLFPRRARSAVACIYALVRVADEIVDGAAAAAGLDRDQQCAVLDELEAEVERTLERGFSANLVVHAFADVARRSGIGTDLTRPFFASMRRDLDPVDFTDEGEYREYVYGSAEVVGLMCLRVFLTEARGGGGSGSGADAAATARVEASARALGSAFQKVNFLRDLADDRTELGRSYLPQLHDGLTPAAKAAVVTEIRGELRQARAGIPHLPRDCRLAVAAATAIFGELLRRIERTPIERLARERVSVPNPVKLALVARERARLIGARG